MSEKEFTAPLVDKTEDGLLKLTDAGREALEPMVTSLDDQVYAFMPGVDTTIAAAGMARLSRSPNDLRTIVASEFIEKDAGSEELIRRVVTNFGDDSVMQLDSMQLVFEGVSNIATKEGEDGRPGVGYLEQSTRYLRFDRRDEEGRYRYVTPEEFDDGTKEVYEKSMDEIMDIYSELYTEVRAHIEATSTEENRDAAWRTAVHAQACDSIRGLLPAATKATFGMSGSVQSIYNMILRMEGESLPELRRLGQQALKAARVVAPVFFERVDMPDRGGLISSNKLISRQATRARVASLIEAAEISETTNEGYVKLLSVDGTEDEVLAKIIVDHSAISFENATQLVSELTPEDREAVVADYVGERYNRRVKPGRAFELPHYSYEAVMDFGAFRDLHRHRIVDGLTWQRLNPNLGHVRSATIDAAGVTEKYEQAFKISENLYETLQDRGYEEQAQYATLFGHNMRTTFKINARSLYHSAELRTTPQGHPSYRKVYREMAEAAAEAHPLLMRHMKFLGQAEDLELARLGAARATQARLEQLDQNS